MSAVRLGPVISTIELETSAGCGTTENSSSRPVNSRSTGTTAICAGGNNYTNRASLWLDSITSDPVSASA
jgi:hypothetical protein